MGRTVRATWAVCVKLPGSTPLRRCYDPFRMGPEPNGTAAVVLQVKCERAIRARTKLFLALSSKCPVLKIKFIRSSTKGPF